MAARVPGSHRRNIEPPIAPEKPNANLNRSVFVEQEVPREIEKSCCTVNKCLLALYVIAIIGVAIYLAKAPTETLSDGSKITIGLSVGLAPPLLYALYHKIDQWRKRNEQVFALL